jgi:hypothetical protein
MLDYADQGRLSEPTQMTLAQAGKRWLEVAHADDITNRSGRGHKPSTLRAFWPPESPWLSTV